MFLNRIHLNPRSREARRDLADPYQMHSTLCRAFCEPDRKCPKGKFLWRLEPETDNGGFLRVLIQSRSLPDWPRISALNWLAVEPDPSVDLVEKLKLNELKSGQRFRFRMRANPCVTRQGKRLGLLQRVDQESWIARIGRDNAGFSLPKLPSFGLNDSEESHVDVRISQERMIRGRQPSGNELKIFSVLYDGILSVNDTDKFLQALQSGIGHGKVLGLGLLSVVPVA